MGFAIIVMLGLIDVLCSGGLESSVGIFMVIIFVILRVIVFFILQLIVGVILRVIFYTVIF
jgi:hypothetical protein